MQLKLFTIALLITTYYAGSLGADSATWPQRRGANWDAIVEDAGKLETWRTSTPPIVWSRRLGRGYSGFIAAEGRLFTQTQSLTRQTVECLDPRTGKTVWQYSYDWPFNPGGLYPGPRATPTWYDGKVYFVSPDLLVGCLDGRSGKLLWKRDLNEDYKSRGTSFGYSCSPTIVEGRLILPIGAKDAGVLALDPGDGSTIWTAGRYPASYCSAIPVMFGGHRFAVVLTRNYVLLLYVKTGKIVWEKKLSSGYDEHASAPLWEVIDETAYLVITQPFHASAKCFTLKLKTSEAANTDSDTTSTVPEVEAKLAWTQDDFSNDTASSVLYRGHVYGFDLKDVQAKKQRPSKGVFKCLDVTDGRVCWESDKPGHATVVVADEKLLLWNDQGEFILARASPEKYEELARATIFSNEICWTAPTLYDGRVFLRSPTRAACLALRDTSNLTDYQLPASSWFDLINLRAWVAGERPYMMDPPDGVELWRWYLFSILGVFLPAIAVGLLMTPFLPRYSSTVFWLVAFLLGLVGIGLYNRIFGPFVLTWPVCLAMAHQRALNLSVLRRATRSKPLPRSRWSSWSAQGSILFLLLVCWLYYATCSRLGMALEWAFLMGFLPSWLIALPVAFLLNPKRHPEFSGIRSLLIDSLGYILSFSAFFWSVGLYYLFR